MLQKNEYDIINVSELVGDNASTQKAVVAPIEDVK